MSCYIYWDRIKKIARLLEDYDEQKPQNQSVNQIIPLLDSIEEIAHDETIDFDSAKHILDDKQMNRALKIIRKFYAQLGTRLETEMADKLIKADDPWKTLKEFHFYPRYKILIQNENKLVKFLPQDKVVFIGGGPLPLTLILINKLYGAHGIGIEIDPQVARLSRKVVDKLGLKDEIRIITGDETRIQELEYRVLMIAALAEPKERVFANVWEAVDTITPIIYRTYTGLRAILYSPVTEKATRGFHKEVMILPTGKVNNTSVLIRKVV